MIGGRDRWERRLAGLEQRILLDDREAMRDSNARQLADIAQLRNFALPLLDELAALPVAATWGVWIERLSALATRALRDPDRVLGVLAALNPMCDVGPVRLFEVQGALRERLVDLVTPPSGRRYGKLLVASIDAARGMAFDVVFVPGLAERIFPRSGSRKLGEDPLLLDAARRASGLPLATRDDRLRDERLALRLAIGAASRRVVLSYPRLDVDQGRPRVPSFYGLEVLQAAEGNLPGFDELARRADATGACRIGWPAPDDPQRAIDDAEFDLGVLDELLRAAAPAKGGARYLLAANDHLARALRTRARRWNVSVRESGGRADPVAGDPVAARRARDHGAVVLADRARGARRVPVPVRAARDRQARAARGAGADRAVVGSAPSAARCSSRSSSSCSASCARPVPCRCGRHRSTARATASTPCSTASPPTTATGCAPRSTACGTMASPRSAPTCASGCGGWPTTMPAGRRTASSSRSVSIARTAATRRAATTPSSSTSASSCAARSTSSSRPRAARCAPPITRPARRALTAAR